MGDEPVEGDAELPEDDDVQGADAASRKPATSKRDRSNDDDWDDDWDDEDWTEDGAGSGLDLRLVGAVLAAVVLVVLVVLFTRSDGDDTDDQAQQPSEQNSPGAMGNDNSDPGGFCGDWPGGFGGDGANATATDGVHIWSDFDGVHVRSNIDQPVKVKLTANSDMTVKEAGTAATLSAQSGREIVADFGPGDGSDGPDLDVSCFVTVLTVEVTGPDGPLDPTQVNIGGSSVATENPYRLVREST